MTQDAHPACRRNCWLTAALFGVAVAAFLRLASHAELLAALLLGGLIAIGLGGFLRWAFCCGRIPYVVPAPVAPFVPLSVPVPSPEARGDAARAPVDRTETPSAAPARSVAAPARAPEIAAPKAAPPRPVRSGPFAPLETPAEEPPAPAHRLAPAKAKVDAAKASRTPKARAAATPGSAIAKAPARSRSATKPKAPDRRTEPKAAPKPAALPPRASGLDFAVSRSKAAVPAAAAPEMLAAPRDGSADDLKQIRGIGPVIETLLNQLGFWHFDQIAGWKARDIAYVDERLVGFHGRISRDEWVRQAQALAAGGTTDEPRKAARRKGGPA